MLNGFLFSILFDVNNVSNNIDILDINIDSAIPSKCNFGAMKNINK